MSEPTIRIELESDRVCVGGEVRGRLHAGPVGASPTARDGVISLAWRTSGECDAEVRVASQLSLPLVEDAAFALKVPAAGPMSYSGAGFSIAWHVRLTVSSRPESSVECPVTVVAATFPPRPA